MGSGIYIIINLVNRKFYVGSAIDFNRRWYSHKHALRANKHANLHVQNAWNEYGEGNFEFKTIEDVLDKSQLIVREQHYLDALSPEYNICKVAGYGSRLNIPCSEYAKKRIGDFFAIEKKQWSTNKRLVSHLKVNQNLMSIEKIY